MKEWGIKWKDSLSYCLKMQITCSYVHAYQEQWVRGTGEHSISEPALCSEPSCRFWCSHPISGVRVLVPSASLLIEHPDNAPGNSAEAGPGIWVPGNHTGDLLEFPDSWLQPYTVPALTSIWRVNQQIQDISVYLLISTCHDAFQINHNNKTIKQ